MHVVVFGGITGVFVMLGNHYWNSLFEKATITRERSFWVWVGRGVGLPMLIWFLANLGVSQSIPPLLPGLSRLSASGFRWFFVVCSEVSPGFAFIGSLWAAVTLGWLAVLICVNAESRREFAATFVVCSLISCPIAWLILYLGGWLNLGVAAIVVLGMGVHFTLELVPSKQSRPTYSRAIAKLKFGKYDEAELDVIRELENQEDDYEGWMLLAELYATRFDDLPGATQVISDLVAQPNITSIQVSIAMHRLADWHLKYKEDPIAARTILEDLSRRIPGGHVARMAQVRIRGLPSTKDELRERQNSKPIRLPALSEDSPLPSDSDAAEMEPKEAMKLTNRCVEKLTRDPNNVAAREELARLMAERLGKVDLAAEQIGLLMEMPGQPPNKQAEWLSLLAAWQLRYKTDRQPAITLMRRLVREFSNTPQAFAAQRRLNLLEMDERIERVKAKQGGKNRGRER